MLAQSPRPPSCFLLKHLQSEYAEGIIGIASKQAGETEAMDTTYHLNAEYAAIMGGMDEDAQRAATAIDAVLSDMEGATEAAENIRKDAAEARLLARAL